MASHASGESALQRIRGIAFDVDGVLTDGGVWWGPGGEEWKRFSFADIMGVSLARRAGLVLALTSGENSPLVDRYATKMHIQYVFKGCRDKAAALREFASVAQIDLSEICCVGDDVNDLPAMEIAGFCAAPSNSAAEILRYVCAHGFVAKARGGCGAVREYIDAILEARHLSGRELFQRRPPE